MARGVFDCKRYEVCFSLPEISLQEASNKHKASLPKEVHNIQNKGSFNDIHES